MSGAGETPDALADALTAARLCAIDPRLGGIVLRGGGELRGALVEKLRTGLGEDAPLRRLPVHIDDERLLGGLDLGATLSAGRAINQAGLLAEAAGGIVVMPMAERMSDATAARIATATDGGATSFLAVAFDDGIDPDERVPGALAERLAFSVDLSDARYPVPLAAVPLKRGTAEHVRHDEEVLRAIAATAMALGIESARAPLFTLRAARALAALAGRETVADEDIALAARLVLAPRATRVPAMDESAVDEPQTPSPPDDPGDGGEERGDVQPLDDILLAATLAALPKDVLARIAAGPAKRGPRSHARGAGERRKAATRGRLVGVRAGLPRGGLRLSLIDTLRAASPWQRLRGRDGPRVRIRRDDLRIKRFESRAETVTIFAVDASGSAALTRLAEAKGAVELLLAEAYVKRAQVALIAFRGVGAELLLSPTRSLTRARRSLADLPGGGGTPLAAGLTAARELAEVARAKGRTPFVVVLTDGRGNIALDGSAARASAEADAETAAKAFALGGIGAAFIDISPRPRAEGAKLAAAMGARYLPLPRADATAMHRAVRDAQA